MQAATSETESKSLDLSICVHHYTLRAPCPKGQGIDLDSVQPSHLWANSAAAYDENSEGVPQTPQKSRVSRPYERQPHLSLF